MTAPLTAHAVGSMSCVPAHEWDRLVPRGSGTLSHAYLSAWERVELAGLQPCPVVAYGAGAPRPVAASPGHWYDLDLVGTRLPAAAAALRIPRRIVPRLLIARTYELGSPTPLTNPFLVDGDADRAGAIEALVDAALEEGRLRGAQFFVVQNLTSLDCPSARHLLSRGFAAVPVPPTVVVDLPFGSFDEYLEAMRSQYRRRARQALQRCAHLRFEHRERFADVADELARLCRCVYDRAREVRHEVLTAEYFHALSDLEPASVLLARRPDGSIASFAALLADRPWLSFLHCGFERDSGPDDGAYFGLLYEIVRVAIEGGYRDVELGLTTLEPKLDIGGVPVPLYALVRHRNPVIHRAIRLLAGRPVATPEARKVWKDGAPSAADLVARREVWA